MAKGPSEVGKKRLTSDQMRVAQTVEEAVDLWLDGQVGNNNNTYVFSEFFSQRKLWNRTSFTPEIAQHLERKYIKAGWDGANFDFVSGVITLKSIK